MNGTDSSMHTVQLAAARLAAGALVAFPTETVYGLGARADDDAAVARIFALKGRPAQHPLIVHAADAAAARAFAATVSTDAQRLMDAFWPGPLTLILPRLQGRASAAAGGQDSIGLRVPSHPMALALLRACADLGVLGVAAPSANRFGRVSPTSADHVRQEFGPDLMVLDGGPCPVGIESAIVDCTGVSPALLRPGQLSALALQAVLRQTLAAPSAASPRVSGSLASHYAPAVRVRLFSTEALLAALRQGHGQLGKTVGVYSRTSLVGLGAGWFFKPMPQDAPAAAQALFAALRSLERLGLAELWIEQPPAGPEWDGVRDRLSRAAA
jgi:L-threonylcarbamoyladenylate synthase